ncbi:MAG: ATP-binding protein [Anaerolineales bacterium]|nr:ATP-binding protein [Anaerolineales bacterium]
MIIAVASGKGGTGKTTVATSLARSLDVQGASLLFLDADVEAPNSHLFLKPEIEHTRDVGVRIPEVNQEICSLCGKCAEVCQYHAIAVLGKKVLVFPQLCHSCGSCTLMCPEGAISEKQNVIGVLEHGPAQDGFRYFRGVMNVGEPMALPIVRLLKQWAGESDESQVVVIDAPPGTSCPMVEAVCGADFLLLVTEPTPFGLHDLKLALQIAAKFTIPVGVIINRDGLGYQGVDEFCAEAGLSIIIRIPFDRSIAEGTARGRTLLDIYPSYKTAFQNLFKEISNYGVGSRWPRP